MLNKVALFVVCTQLQGTHFYSRAVVMIFGGAGVCRFFFCVFSWGTIARPSGALSVQ